MKNSKNVKVCQFGKFSFKKHINDGRVHCIGLLKGEIWLGFGLHQRGAYHMQSHLL